MFQKFAHSFFIVLRSHSKQCIHDVNLVGRDLVDPKCFTSRELKSLLWTALDLRCLSKQRNLNLPAVQDAKISLIMDKPCFETQHAIKHGAELLNTHVNVIVDSEWNKGHYLEDFGHMSAMYSDLIFCKMDNQCHILCIADGAKVPVVGIASSEFTTIKVLADMMSLILHFEYLKGLTMAWVGLPGSLINTYMYILPRLGLNLKYCTDNRTLVPLFMEDGLRASQKYGTEMQESNTVYDAINRSNVISTAGHNNPNLCVTYKTMAVAAMKWALLHQLPRGECDVEKQVFVHKNCLAWASLENERWIYAALMTRLLAGHTHKIQEPIFEKRNNAFV